MKLASLFAGWIWIFYQVQIGKQWTGDGTEKKVPQNIFSPFSRFFLLSFTLTAQQRTTKECKPTIKRAAGAGNTLEIFSCLQFL
jgi:hypothetical protein